MHIWAVTVGEPLPTDPGTPRLLRTGILLEELVKRGHGVVWWTSTFDHVRKTHRFDRDTTLTTDAGYRMILLHSTGYRSNVSLRRLADHRGIARAFVRLAQTETKPDIVLCSFPTIELAVAAVAYGRRAGIPVVLDVRDLWPDVFLDEVPPWTRWLARGCLAPLFRATRRACCAATAITGVTSGFVDWGVARAGRAKSTLDVDFPMGYTEKIPDENAVVQAREYWRKRIPPDAFVVCFVGTMGRQFDLDTVIHAARRLRSDGRPFFFVLCGSGDAFNRYQRCAGDCPNVLFPGWVQAAEIWTLMRRASLGLAPYVNTENFILNLPNKPIEYLSAGLPLLSSLGGVVEELISSHDCGMTYRHGDVEDLIGKLDDLYDHPERLKTMASNALGLFQERFTAGRAYGSMATHLEKIAQQGGRN